MLSWSDIEHLRQVTKHKQNSNCNQSQPYDRETSNKRHTVQKQENTPMVSGCSIKFKMSASKEYPQLLKAIFALHEMPRQSSQTAPASNRQEKRQKRRNGR
jgi:hypothetical protein